MHEVDLLVIGGGINGAGIARDASGRGLQVLLCEQHDLAAHTSSASSKLIHGGLRYLEKREFGLVRKALGEREIVRRQAPFLVHPLRFVLPWEPHLRPRWMLRLGLWLYDHLGQRSAAFPASRSLQLHGDALGTWLAPHLQDAFSYADAQVDDARLVVLNALDAAQRGARILTDTRCTGVEQAPGHWLATLEGGDGEVCRVQAKAVINAAGPWAGGLLQRMQPGDGAPALRLVQGSHIVLRRPWPEHSACLLQQPDGRVVFLLPFAHDHLLVGTTDTDYRGDPARCSVLPSEVDYLCEAANRYLREPISAGDVVWQFAGVRPLLAASDPQAATLSRDYRLQLQGGGAPAVHVLGGKLTTYRVLAEEALDLLRTQLPHIGPAWTAHGAALPGSDWGDADAARGRLQDLAPWLPAALARRWAAAYGSRSVALLDDATTLSDLGEDFGAGLHAREVAWLQQHEWARSAEDVLWRRSKLGLRLDPTQVARLQAWMQGRIPFQRKGL
ncbi:glycerol-3-phosphate dehydrogenase [Stenotrophomonas sp. ESTM1D_MKCIP4_1]|uniref:glycerol-3-phosphate dehydrogenase n=1 Tax=Stenotrophomonas sp. ESTM1D_MKCIP4_1 TaxID=2072414 RepID=UPI000D53D215|nr:glycerol-3-phosphate dehydrogenase [Stenotrophomonas sp. ESTM1D_MKCIP4_1]AWH54840.1 glycerol-3-phosphate dehydrogenase [Stenotrophomonas sp. ESTM1D_MKCIP4_1]